MFVKELFITKTVDKVVITIDLFLLFVYPTTKNRVKNVIKAIFHCIFKTTLNKCHINNC